MSADFWAKCPKCNAKEDTVRFDECESLELNNDGTIDSSCVRAYCTKCEAKWTGKK